MKEYNNGQRPAKMYGGGTITPRKPTMGGLASENRIQQSPMAKNMGIGMTEQKSFSMGMYLGGAIAKFEGRQKKASGNGVKGTKLTGKKKELAAMYGNPNKITRGDIITAAKKKAKT
jgi:hypothetical protein